MSTIQNKLHCQLAGRNMQRKSEIISILFEKKHTHTLLHVFKNLQLNILNASAKEVTKINLQKNEYVFRKWSMKRICKSMHGHFHHLL